MFDTQPRMEPLWSPYVIAPSMALAIRSANMMTVRFVGVEGISGKIEASTTLSPST